MYESDGSVMVYWHALDITEHPPGKCRSGSAARGSRIPPVLPLAGWDRAFLLGSLVPAGLGPQQHRSHVQAGLSQAGAAWQVSRRVWKFCTILTPLAGFMWA